ncbi:MAG: MerR family transcriptional regulator [Spirochaetes bacterium]|nr:MerR family transcriptional regulator [Spirochaetota bacterium]
MDTVYKAKIYYTISEVSKMMSLSIDTLRFYEKTDIIGSIHRDSGGRRLYSEENLEWILFVCRLKNTGMPLDDIREYRKLLLEGDHTSSLRQQLMVQHKVRLEHQIEELQSALDLMNYKIRHYDNIIKNHGLP